MHREVFGQPDAMTPDSVAAVPDGPHVPSSDPDTLRQDLGKEYYAILSVISEYDQRLVTVKGWSVTLSLAGLAVGFQQQHYALFGLAAITGLAFWFIDAHFKGYQLHYYSRMRDIEVAAYYLNRVDLPELGELSSPRIDMYWPFKGFQGEGDPRRTNLQAAPPLPDPRDWRLHGPWRRTPLEIRSRLRRRWWMPNVVLPHAVAVLLGAALFAAAAADLSGLGALEL